MTDVEIRLKGTQEINGEIYLSPIKAGDAPIRPAKEIRATTPGPYRLDDGKKYSLRFNLTTGKGKLTLTAVNKFDDTKVYGTEDFNLAAGASLVQFRFRLPVAS